MKKVFVSLALVVFALTTVQEAKGQVDFGITGGISLNKVSFRHGHNLDSDNRCGWMVGPKVVVSLPVVGLGLDFSVQYSQRRINVYYSDDPESYTGSTDYKSLEIPINVRYGYGSANTIFVFVYTGPQFGFNVGDKDWDWFDKDSYRFKDSFFTWNIGCGVRVFRHIEITGAYNFALSKLARNDFEGGGRSASFKGNSGQILLTYYF